jgi:thiamine-phosphate pyrophosphorylase
MEKVKFPYRLYLVISEAACVGSNFLTVAESAVQGGADLVQLREKSLNTASFAQTALRLQELLSKYNVPLIINDNVEVAQQTRSYGIHVGRNDIGPVDIKSRWKECQLLGYSIEDIEQLYNEQVTFSDYLGISPVYKSVTKQDTVTEWGLEGIRKIRSITHKPLVAIGDMNASNAYETIKAGADCIAVVSAICQAPCPAKAAFEIRNQIEKAL